MSTAFFAGRALLLGADNRIKGKNMIQSASSWLNSPVCQMMGQIGKYTVGYGLCLAVGGVGLRLIAPKLPFLGSAIWGMGGYLAGEVVSYGLTREAKPNSYARSLRAAGFCVSVSLSLSSVKVEETAKQILQITAPVCGNLVSFLRVCPMRYLTSGIGTPLLNSSSRINEETV